MATSRATENNQKLFHLYAKKFALSQPLVYTFYADKLSLWLSDFKAYYAAARPQIVKLLLIAQMTLRKVLGLAENLNSPFNISEYSEHPMVKSFIRLVKTVEPFEHCFTEPGLLVHIKSLLALVSPHAPGRNQPISHFQSDEAHSHISETLTLPASYVSESQITGSSSNTMIIASNILPVVAKAQAKAKKRKAVDFDLLVQRDIKALLEKQGNQDSSQHVTEESMMSLRSLGDHAPYLTTASLPSLPSQDVGTAAEPHGALSPAQEDQEMAGLDQIMGPLQDSSAAAKPQGTSPPCEDQIMAAPDQITKPLPCQDTSAAAEPSHDTSASVRFRETSSPACEDQIIAGPDQIIQPLPSQDRSAAAEVLTSSQVVAEDPETTPPGLVMVPLSLQQPIESQVYSSQTVAQDREMEAGDTIEACLPSIDAVVATEFQSSTWHPIAQEQEKQKTAPRDSEDSAPLPSPKTSSSTETQGSTSISKESATASPQSSPQTNLTSLVSSDHLGNISSLVPDIRPLASFASAENLVMGSPRSTMTCQGKFGQEMRIVAYRKGLRKECLMSFTCTVSSALFPKVSAWLNRNVFSLDIEHSLCLSLGCYSIADLQQESVQNDCTTLGHKTSVARSYWPQRGGLGMNVQFKNGREDLPLSPPFQVTPDGLVDVSQFLFAGKNVIKLKQTTDMSQYIFVLHSHNPTRAQLQEVNGRRQKDKEWQEWARHVSRPFDIPSNLILQT